MDTDQFVLQAIGVIRSPISTRADAPCQGDEGGVDAWIEIADRVAAGLTGLKAGDELLIFTWLHAANRDVLQVHPRRKLDRPLLGVFATRSPDRPNPIGLHRVSLLAIQGNRLRVAPMEAIDGTPVVDIKPVLRTIVER
ncbi:MAG TPA: tRNA (N6-threonylcarbamoyladenosine(37)-N6)-methyltransferase TrmO [Burkholderiales bacterium]